MLFWGHVVLCPCIADCSCCDAGSVETTTKTRTTGVPVNDVKSELRQGQLIDTQVDRKNNHDGTVTETTV